MTNSSTSPPLRSFGAALKQQRARRGLTGQELGALVGIGEPMLSHLEVGRRAPTRLMLQRLVAALECSPYDAARLYLLAEQLPPGRFTIAKNGRVRQTA